jgi:hypothetical protein
MSLLSYYVLFDVYSDANGYGECGGMLGAVSVEVVGRFEVVVYAGLGIEADDGR